MTNKNSNKAVSAKTWTYNETGLFNVASKFGVFGEETVAWWS